MSNRLSGETSPYLLQHADNPVDWHPWGDAALALARSEGKPILLSIGYSACHWCHVMAHESFEDTATADVMNDHFINIKVDREERPDLDKVYQTAHQLLTHQAGGWPLTMFLDPATLLPFFAGTYFPKSARFQLPGFTDLLLRITDVFATKRDSLTQQGEQIREMLARLSSNDAGPAAAQDAEVPLAEVPLAGVPLAEVPLAVVPLAEVPTAEVPMAEAGANLAQAAQPLLEEAAAQLSAQYDQAEGGFGDAPKFPMPGTLDRVLRQWAFSEGARDRKSLDMVMTTLTKMARGGIYDHLAGGFCRYATDRRWMVPHFEKMLYDNGQLLSIYADVLAVSPDELFTQAVSATAEWLQRDMRHPAGGFYAALDADSEGEEGKYYVWRRDAIKRLLSEDEYLVMETLYGLDKPANFEGKWNLHRYDSWPSVVHRLSMKRPEADEILASARSKLLIEREKRVRPGLDDKILTSWNGLVIKGLAKAGVQLDRREWLASAQACADFLRDSVWQEGRLYATWKDGSARHPAYLDDYANLLDGLLTLLSAQWREVDAAWVIELADGVVENFYDAANGGFYFTAHDHESLIYRPKPTTDDALPPGNGVITRVLLQLGHLFGDTRYLDAVERTLAWAQRPIAQYPAGHCSLLTSLELFNRPNEQIIIRGSAGQLEEWLAASRTGYTPWRHVYAIAYEGNTTLPAYLPKLVSAEMRDKTVAYRCEGLSCSLPIDDLAAFRQSLASTPVG